LLKSPLWRRALMQGVAATIEHEGLPFRSDYGTVIDVGAHKGQFAVYARHRFPRAALYCFEPLAGPRRKLQQVLADGRPATIVAAAVGSSPGNARINVSRSDDSSSLLAITQQQVTAFPGTDLAGTAETEVVTLDDFFAGKDLSAPVLLKLDVQGFELEALRGAVSLLPRVDSVLVECSFVELYAGQPHFDEILFWLRERGFGLRGGNITSSRGGAWLQGDFFFENAPSARAAVRDDAA
jgi:FkbM family methyltransferase